MGVAPVSRQPRLADSADKISEVGAPTRRKRCAASARCVAIMPCRSPHSCTPPSHGMPRDTSPARSFVWETGLNFGQRRILAVARTDDHMARDRDLLPGGAAARADERWRRRCRPGAPPVLRSVAGRRGAGSGWVGHAEGGASGGLPRLAWCMVGGGCQPE